MKQDSTIHSCEHIFVGSTNPVKINAVTQAASETWPEVTVQGFAIPSHVSDQPRGDEETRQGARNRAQGALSHGLEQVAVNKDDTILGVGLEGGVVEFGEELFSTVWVAVTDQAGNVSESNGARFAVPPIIAEKIRRGQEMGPVVEQLVGREDVRRQQGMIGIITEGFVDRTEEYMGIAKMALGLWYGRHWAKSLA